MTRKNSTSSLRQVLALAAFGGVPCVAIVVGISTQVHASHHRVPAQPGQPTRVSSFGDSQGAIGDADPSVPAATSAFGQDSESAVDTPSQTF